MRIGFGYDIHRLVEGRALVLGGVRIPSARGLDGHSDADVLSHAVIDALLGAAGLGDLGRHFPDSDPAYEGISSLELLKRTVQRIREQGCTVGNVDVTVVAEAPPLAPFTEEMAQRVAGALGVALGQVNIKASRNDGLGPVGREEGMAAYAVVLLKESRDRA